VHGEESTKVKLTRRRFDAYFAPLFIASLLVTGYCFWQTGQARFWAAPLGVLLIWQFLRYRLPVAGVDVPTIRSTPGAITLLCCCAFSIVLFLALLAIDIYVLNHPFRAPLKPYHALLFSPPFIVMIGGGFLADRIKKRDEAKSNPQGEE